MSDTSSIGLVGDSIHSSAAPSSAARTASWSVGSTRRTTTAPVVGELVEQRRRAVVGVRRDDDGAAVRDEGERGRHRGHPRGEDEGVATLEPAQGLLERRPRRVAGARVVDRPVGDVGRGELEGRVDAGTRHTGLASQGDDAGGGGQVLVAHAGQRRGAAARAARGARRMVGIRSAAMTTDQPATHKPRVAIVFGGRSSEHAVSCATAAGVMRAIDRDAYDVIPIGISRDGHWVLSDGDPQLLELTADRTPEVAPDGAGVVVPLATTDRTLTTLEPQEIPRSLGEVDVVFPLLHGPFGEDGTIQGMFEMADIRYVGSGVFASAAGMDKHYMKVLFAGAGLPVGPYAVITDSQWRRDKAAAMDARRGAGLPGVRQAGAGRVEHGDLEGVDSRGARGGHRDGPRARPQGHRRAGHRRSRDRVRRAPGAGHRRARGSRTSARSR